MRIQEKLKKLLAAMRVYPLILLFFAFLGLYTICDMLAPKRDISELENRPLMQNPPFTLSAFFDNQWTKDYGEYTKDQFLFRDGWITLQSAIESLQGKLENGGVWFGRGGYLIAKNSVFSALQQRSLPLNTEALASLASRHPGRVTAMIVPSPANILSNELRWSPPQVDENTMLNNINEQVGAAGAQVIDLREAFFAAEEPVYYHTDHHWTTTVGAFIAYEAFCESRGLQAVRPADELLVAVPGFYGTNYSKSKKIGTPSETMLYYNFPNMLTVHSFAQNGTPTAETGPLMDEEKLLGYDKYGAFLRGNNGYSELEGNGEGSILVVKDSYGNSFVPYLIQNYARIGIIDLRAWPGVDETFAEGGYDEILVLYSFDNFTSDTYVARMASV